MALAPVAIGGGATGDPGPPFVILPLETYYIRQDYTAGVLTGGTAISTDSVNPVELYSEFERVGGSPRIVTKQWILAFVRGGKPDGLGTGTYCAKEFWAIFPTSEPANDEYSLTATIASAPNLLIRGNVWGYIITQAYSASFAWDNLPTMVKASGSWSGNYANEQTFLQHRSYTSGAKIEYEPIVRQPLTIRSYNLPTLGNHYGFAIEIDSYSMGGTDGDTAKIVHGKYNAVGPIAKEDLSWPLNGWLMAYFVPTGRCV